MLATRGQHGFARKACRDRIAVVAGLLSSGQVTRGGVPRPAVRGGRRLQVIEADREHHHRDDHENTEHRADQRRAHRERRARAALIEREPDPGRHRWWRAELGDRSRGERRAGRFASDPHHSSRAHRRDRRDREDDEHDDHRAEREQRPVDPDARVGLRLLRHAEWKPLRRDDRAADREDGPADGDRESHRGGREHARARSDTQSAQRHLVGVDERDLARQGDPHAHQTGDRRDRSSDVQTDRRHVDRVLRALAFDAEALDREHLGSTPQLLRDTRRASEVRGAGFGPHAQD